MHTNSTYTYSCSTYVMSLMFNPLQLDDDALIRLSHYIIVSTYLHIMITIRSVYMFTYNNNYTYKYNIHKYLYVCIQIVHIHIHMYLRDVKVSSARSRWWCIKDTITLHTCIYLHVYMSICLHIIITIRTNTIYVFM
jgi:hypothetical protein